MKILLMTTSSDMAGTEKNVLSLACFLKKKGCEVEIITLTGKGEMIESAKKEDIRSINMGFTKYKFDFIKLKRTIRNNGYDIIHSFLFHSNLISRLLKKKEYLINSFRSEDKWKRGMHYLLECLTNKKVNVFTVNFPNYGDFIKKHGIETVHYIPNGVAINENVFSNKCFTVGLIGRFHPVKNHMKFIEQYLQHKIINMPIYFNLRGEGRLKKQVIDAVLSKKIDEKIRVFDHTKDKKAIYEGMSLVICVSKYEGFPNTLIEANSFGIPVVSFNVGAASDIVSHGENGYLVGDFNELFDKIIYLYENPEVLKNNSERSLELVKRFSEDEINQRYLEIYNKGIISLLHS